MAYYMWRKQLEHPVEISEASFTVGELYVSVEVTKFCLSVSALCLLSKPMHLHPSVMPVVSRT